MHGNAKIIGTGLGYEGHGILSCHLTLEQEGSCQVFGGWDLRAEGEAFRWIDGILKTVGVDRWEDLGGKYIRVDGEHGGKINKIGHIVENKWFNPNK